MAYYCKEYETLLQGLPITSRVNGATKLERLMYTLVDKIAGLTSKGDS